MVSWHRYVVFLCVAHHCLSFVALQVWQVWYIGLTKIPITICCMVETQDNPISLYHHKHVRIHKLTALLWWLIFPLLSVAW